jgi:hypothetical protein
MSDKALPGAGGVLRLRNLAMLESIRRVADPAWRDRLERQQTLASRNAVHIRGILGHAGTPVSDERQPWPAPLPAFLPASASATTSASA